MKKIIRGAKGGNRNRTPERAPDNLNSRQFANILDLLSEGEIEGFSTPSKEGQTLGTADYLYQSLKDIFLDDTPILKASFVPNSNTAPNETDFNFTNVRFDLRTGLATQPLIPDISSSRSVVGVNSKVAKNNPREQQITNHLIHAVGVTITFPSLQLLKDNGDIEGLEVNLQIKAEYNSSGTQELVIDDKIKGRSADPYQKQYRFPVDKTRFFQSGHTLDVSVHRVTDDAESSETQKDEFVFTHLEEIVADSNTYPDCAYTLLRLDSEQFSNIPKRVFKIRGIKVRIPGAGANNSGTPVVINNQADADTYGLGPVSSFGFIHYPAGYIFNGTMQAAKWTTCPAMILLDLLTNQRYGLGTQIAPNFDPSNPSDTDLYANVDLFSLVTASKYSNELVSDLSTQAGTVKEPRFSCNVNIQSSKEAFNLINEVAGCMRAFPIWQTGSITITQDRPTTSSYLFSLANVSEAGFSYTGSSLKQRHTQFLVSYFNLDSKEIDTEVVDAEQATIDRLGLVQKQIKAFGTTSRGQAIRLGRAVLYSEQQESEIVTFETSIEAGVLVRPGSVISVADPLRGGKRRSGRIKTATTNQVTVDNDLDLDNFAGINKKCSVIMSDGTVSEKDCSVDTVNNQINLVSGQHFQIKNSSGSFVNAIPQANSIWMLSSTGTDGLEPQKFRVLSVEEKDELVYVITGLSYRDGKYPFIDQGDPLPPRFISLLNRPAPPPSNLRVTNQNGESKEMIVTINNLAVSKLLLVWTGVSGVSQYLVQYRFNSGNWVNEVVFRTDFEILDTDVGLYEFRVFSFNAALTLSTTSANLSFKALGKTAPPADVKNLTMEPITNKLIRLRWDESIDPDVIHGGKVYVRHSNKQDGTGTFQNSIDLIEALAGNTTDAVVPSLDGEYILKFRDDQGNFSLGETSIIMDLPDLIDSQRVFTDREDTDSPPFNGTRNNVTYADGVLKLANPALKITGTYNQTGREISISINSLPVYNISVGETLQINFTSGRSKSGIYTVKTMGVPNSTYLTVEADNIINPATAGTVSIDRGLRGSYIFQSLLDCGSIFALNLKRYIQTISFALGGETIQATYERKSATFGSTVNAFYVRTTATVGGTSQTVIEITSNNHGRSVGDFVQFTASAGGATNGTFEIVATTTNTFQFLASGSAISSSACTYIFVQTVIEITSNSHGRSVGDYINFSSITAGTQTTHALNGVYRIVVATTNTFQYLAPGPIYTPIASGTLCTYAFVNTIDQLIPLGSFWDDYAPNGNFDGPEINDASASISVSTTNDDPSSSSAVFTPFNTFANGTYRGRGFKFKVEMKVEDVGHNIAIQQLGIFADFEARTERNYIPSNSTTPTSVPQESGTSASGKDVNFANPFFVGTVGMGGLREFPPALGITIMGAAAGEYFVIKTDSNGDFLNAAGQIVTGTGFNIKILDANNTPINKRFSFQAVGYGKGV